MVHLGLLAQGLVDRFVVGDRHHQIGDIFPEQRGDLVRLHALVFHAIMEQGGDDEVRILAAGGLGHQVRHLGQVVDVRLLVRALAALVGVLAGGKVEGVGNADKFGGGGHGRFLKVFLG